MYVIYHFNYTYILEGFESSYYKTSAPWETVWIGDNDRCSVYLFDRNLCTLGVYW